MREMHIICYLLLHHRDLILNEFTIIGGENLASCLVGLKTPLTI